MANCVPGDLAEVIKSVFDVNVGKIVQVIKFMGLHTQYGIIWRIRGKDIIPTEYGGMNNEADCPDDWLRPIKPPPIPETDITDEPLIHEKPFETID